jgi:hypothetical protein
MKAAWANRAVERQEQRRERRRLVSEVISYRTPAERLELELILARYPENDTLEITRILRSDDATRDFAA